MAAIDQLRKQWQEEAAVRPFHPYLHIDDDGLVLGAGTLLAPMIKDHSGAPVLALDGNEEQRIIALLSLGYRRTVSITTLEFIKRAALQWAKGQMALAHFELAYARLPRFETREDARHLFYANELLRKGVSARALMFSQGLDTHDFDLLKYNADQPRVPAGSGRESGQWTSGAAADSAPISGESAHIPDITTFGSSAEENSRASSSSLDSSGRVMSDVPLDPIQPGQQYAQSIKLNEPPPGTPILPYGEPYVPFALLPPGSKQILQYRFFVQDEKTKLWYVGMDIPREGSQSRPTLQTRGQGAGIDNSGEVISPPGSPPLPPVGSGENPRSGMRYGLWNPATGLPYFRVFNDQAQPISPVTGRTVPKNSPLGHYPINIDRSGRY